MARRGEGCERPRDRVHNEIAEVGTTWGVVFP